MDERSSIFSSKRTLGGAAAAAAVKPVHPGLLGRLPLGFLGALGIIAGIEVSLHLTKWPNPIPYALGRDEYYAVAATIARSGSANVAIVGSSRSREGISVPMMHSILHTRLGREVSVINYSTGGGRAIDFDAIINRLLHAKPMPRTIILGLSERDFAGTGWQYNNAPLYWNLHDWRVNYERRGSDVLDDLPTVLRNTAGQYIRLLGRREQIRLRLNELVRGQSARSTPSPVRGEPTPWHVTAAHKKINRKDPEMRAKVQMYVQRDLIPEQYPDPDQVAALERLAQACQERHVRLIIYEMPISPQLLREMPEGMNDTYRQTTVRIAQQYGAQFVRLKDLGLKPAFRDFREPSHMNLDGSQKLTQALTERVLVPALKRDAERDKREAKRAANAAKRGRHPSTTHVGTPSTQPNSPAHPATEPAAPTTHATTRRHPSSRPATVPAR